MLMGCILSVFNDVLIIDFYHIKSNKACIMKVKRIKEVSQCTKYGSHLLPWNFHTHIEGFVVAVSCYLILGHGLIPAYH